MTRISYIITEAGLYQGNLYLRHNPCCCRILWRRFGSRCEKVGASPEIEYGI